MKTIVSIGLALALTACASLTRTNRLLERYRGHSIDEFMSGEVMAAVQTTPLADGGAVYMFRGGPGGYACEMYVTTDKNRIITNYRFAYC